MNTAGFRKAKKSAGFFLLVFYFLFHSASAESLFKITGTFSDGRQSELAIVNDRFYINRAPEEIKIPVNTGHFEAAINLDKSRLLKVIGAHQLIYIYAEPGGDLQLALTGADSLDISFSGKGAEQNVFLRKFYKQFKNDFDDSVMCPKMLTSGIDVFEMQIFDQQKKEAEFFRNAPDKNKFSPGFISFIQNTIRYRYWNLLFAFPIINANVSRSILTVNGLPTVMLDVFTKVQVNNDSALICQPYREFLKYYIIYFTSQANGFNKFNDFSVSTDRKLAMAKDRLKDEAYKFWLAKYTTDECAQLSPFMTKKLFNELLEVDKPAYYAPAVKEICGDKMAMKEEKKKEENTSPSKTTTPTSSGDELDLTDAQGKHVALKDFKGKVVYIDFWASWCGPCRMMMPYSKNLHEQLTEEQKKKIVFLYISIDADQNAWKKGMEDLGIQGVNVNSPGNWSSKACKYFQIGSIPRYMIMNKKGEIVDVNAKRPADPSVVDDLIKLIGE